MKNATPGLAQANSSSRWDFLSSFSNSAARRILHYLQNGATTPFTELQSFCQMDDSTLQTLLDLMQSAGLIERRLRRGQAVYGLASGFGGNVWTWEKVR
jgi:predicted transcriptional regulator